MGMGPNYILSKGHLATGATAYAFGELVVAAGTGTSCARATTPAAKVRGVCQEAIDVGKVTTGKAVINIALMGIVRVLAGAAVAVDDRVTNDATARAVTANVAVGAKEYFGVALTAATAAGQYIDVLLTPYGNINTAVS
jgi:hypothetical protein